MSKDLQEQLDFIRAVHEDHKSYWEQKMPLMKKYRSAYNNTFWEAHDLSDDMLRIETADGYGYVESFISSLFSKNPSTVFGADLAETGGDAELAQAAANRFLQSQRGQLEIASRLALIYDYSAAKLCPRDSNSMLDRVAVKAIPCWEVILDRDACGPEDQRFIGHCYYLSLHEAKQRFGVKAYTAVPKEDYFQSGDEMDADLPDDFLYIQVTELYDLQNDMVYFWSPSYANGQKLLKDAAEIPVRTYDDQPYPHIIPLFYGQQPDRPMEGMSALARVYDQLVEKNVLRTYWANSVRRDSRQYLYKEGTIDEESLAQLTAGVDGAMIAVDNDTLEGILKPVDVMPISSNFDRYQNYIEADINRASILAPFSRGEATKATATEITALAQYSASEIGKMARDRDDVIEEIARCYIRQLSLLSEEGERSVIMVDGSGKIVSSEDLAGKFRIAALDQGATPLSDSLKKQNLMQLMPVLQQLGVPAEAILEEVVNEWDLPKSFIEKAQKAREAAQAPQAPQGSKVSAPTAGALAGGQEVSETPADTLAKKLM